MSIEQTLLQRCNSKCELCSSDNDLVSYGIPPIDISDADNSIMICRVCSDQIENPDQIDINHWHCLNESMWSTVPAVQVMAWRLLNLLSTESWARDLLDMLYLEEDVQTWAKANSNTNNKSDDIAPTRDSNGTVLSNGDSVTLIKDLIVKGANFTAKRGTTVRNISLTSNPGHIEGRVNGTQIVLLSCFLKRAS